MMLKIFWTTYFNMETLSDILDNVILGEYSHYVAEQKILGLYNVSYCANEMKIVFTTEFVDEAKKRPNKIIRDEPEMVLLLNTISKIEKYCK